MGLVIFDGSIKAHNIVSWGNFGHGATSVTKSLKMYFWQVKLFLTSPKYQITTYTIIWPRKAGKLQ